MCAPFRVIETLKLSYYRTFWGALLPITPHIFTKVFPSLFVGYMFPIVYPIFLAGFPPRSSLQTFP